MKRVLVFFLGMVVAVLGLEIGLRVSGFVYKAGQRVVSSWTGKGLSSKHVILCLGNSYTKGFGVAPGKGYPEQLNRLIDHRQKDQKVLVINQGHGGENTAELLTNLELNIKMYRPDLIILQTGQPNRWNYSKCTDYYQRIGKLSLPFRKQVYYFKEVLNESRIFRLYLIIDENLRKKRHLFKFYRKTFTDPFEKEFDEVEEFINNTDSILSPQPSAEVDQKECEKAIRILTKAIKERSDFPFKYLYMAKIFRFQHKYDEALAWLDRAATIRVGLNLSGLRRRVYAELRRLRKISKEKDAHIYNQKIDALIDRYSREYPEEAFNLAILSDEDVDRWVASDLNEIIRIIKAHRIGLIIQNYPIYIPENQLLENAASRGKIPFVDNFYVFQEKLKSGVTVDALFVPDGHCTEPGYGLMAENVLKKIDDEGLLNTP